MNDLWLLTAKIKASKIRQISIAEAVGVDQSQVSRLLRGQVRKRGPLFQKICVYVNNAVHGVDRNAVRANDELISALAETWDGTPEHATALAAVIRSLGVLKSKSRQGETASGKASI